MSKSKTITQAFLLFSLFLSLNVRSQNNAPTSPLYDSIVKVENGFSYQEQFIPEASLPYLQKGLAAEKNFGHAYMSGKYDLETKYGLEALEVFDSLKLINKKAYHLGLFGFWIKRRDLPKAFEYMQKAMDLFPSLNNIATKSAIYNNYGALHFFAEQMDSAIYYHKKSLALDRLRKDSIGIPYALNYLALAYIEVKQFKAAQNCLNEALSIRLVKNWSVGIAENYNYQARLERAQGNIQKSIYNNIKALEISKSIPYPYWIQICSKQIAECYEILEQHKEALRYYKEYNTYKDSILTEKSQEAIATLEVQYETAEKEKKITQQAFDLVEATEKIKRRNILSVSAGIIVLLLVLWGINYYRTQQYKQRRIQERAKLREEIALARVEVEKQEERIRISKELHDNIGAQLTFVISSIDNMLYQSKTDTSSLGSKLADLSVFTRKTITQLRDTIWLMNKPNLTLTELSNRINEYIASTQNLGIDCTIKLEQHPSKKPHSIAKGNNVYRVVQEAINNALKYAHCSQIIIRLEETNGALVGSITDNGTGFKISETKSRGFGLKNMEERIKLLGGELTINSASTGTTIQFTIPLINTNAV